MSPERHRPEWPYVTPGIPEDAFDSQGSPITKEEVRVVALSKARLEADHVIYDVGAGTGSMAVEAALLAARGWVYAIEREAERADLCRLNAARFGVRNLTVIHGVAPESLRELPRADRVIIGGHGGRLAEILHVADTRLRAGGRMVLNAVTVETLALALETLAGLGYEDEASLINVARAHRVAGGRMWRAFNPVYVVTARRRGD